MSLRTYDPKNVVSTLQTDVEALGTQTIEGWADGAFITVEFNEDAYNLYVSSKGEISRANNNNPGGRVTLTLKSTSSSNNFLHNVAQQDKSDNTGYLALTITTQNEEVKLNPGWIVQEASHSYDRVVNEREWVLEGNLVIQNIEDFPTQTIGE